MSLIILNRPAATVAADFKWPARWLTFRTSAAIVRRMERVRESE